MAKRKMTKNNDLQNIHIKLKIEQWILLWHAFQLLTSNSKIRSVFIKIEIIHRSNSFYNVFIPLHAIKIFTKNKVTHDKNSYKLWLPWIISEVEFITSKINI
jgi:hypothetical protein